MANNDLRSTVASSLSKMKFDFSQPDEMRYNTLEEITEQQAQQTDYQIDNDNAKTQSSYLKFSFYQKYFNVNSKDVLYRYNLS